MTARAGSPPTPRSPAGRAATTVRLIRESFAVVEPRVGEVVRLFYAMLFQLAPATRDLFPANMQDPRTRLAQALAHVVRVVDRPDELVPFLRQQGRDHRALEFVAEHYETVGISLLTALRSFAGDAWTDEVHQAWSDIYAGLFAITREAVDTDQGPALWNATVVEHQRLSWDLAIVRVMPEQPVPFRAGQYLSVEVPQRPRLWRNLSPANAPRPDGQLEFHVRAVAGGWVSRAIVGHAQPGERWRIGRSMGGQLSVDRQSGRKVLMVAGGTGVAPMRALLEELCRWGENPQVHLFFGGRTRADLYDLESLRAMAATNPWLTVVPVVEHERTADTEHGTLAEVVTRNGTWAGHDVLVCGSPGMTRSTIARMVAMGTAPDRIRHDPLALD